MKLGNTQQLIKESVLTEETCQTKDPVSVVNPVSQLCMTDFCNLKVDIVVMLLVLLPCMYFLSIFPIHWKEKHRVSINWCYWLFRYSDFIVYHVSFKILSHKCHMSTLFVFSSQCPSSRCSGGFSDDICRYAGSSFPTPWSVCEPTWLIISNSAKRTFSAMKKANTSAVLFSNKSSNSVETTALSGRCGDL